MGKSAETTGVKNDKILSAKVDGGSKITGKAASPSPVSSPAGAPTTPLFLALQESRRPFSTL